MVGLGEVIHAAGHGERAAGQGLVGEAGHATGIGGQVHREGRGQGTGGGGRGRDDEVRAVAGGEQGRVGDREAGRGAGGEDAEAILVGGVGQEGVGEGHRAGGEHPTLADVAERQGRGGVGRLREVVGRAGHGDGLGGQRRVGQAEEIAGVGQQGQRQGGVQRTGDGGGRSHDDVAAGAGGDRSRVGQREGRQRGRGRHEQVILEERVGGDDVGDREVAGDAGAGADVAERERRGDVRAGVLIGGAEHVDRATGEVGVGEARARDGAGDEVEGDDGVDRAGAGQGRGVEAEVAGSARGDGARQREHDGRVGRDRGEVQAVLVGGRRAQRVGHRELAAERGADADVAEDEGGVREARLRVVVDRAGHGDRRTGGPDVGQPGGRGDGGEVDGHVAREGTTEGGRGADDELAGGRAGGETGEAGHGELGVGRGAGDRQGVLVGGGGDDLVGDRDILGGEGRTDADVAEREGGGRVGRVGEVVDAAGHRDRLVGEAEVGEAGQTVGVGGEAQRERVGQGAGDGGGGGDGHVAGGTREDVGRGEGGVRAGGGGDGQAILEGGVRGDLRVGHGQGARGRAGGDADVAEGERRGHGGHGVVVGRAGDGEVLRG